MRLIKLELENFMAHANTVINFTKLGSPVLIKGINLDRGNEKSSNEAGKSTIFRGIDYCLFTKYKHRLRHGASSGRTALTFEHAGDTYTIIKEFTKDDYKPTLYKNNQLISQQKTEVEQYIYKLIGITRKLYEHTIYQNQHFVDTFGNAPKQVKTEFIATLMDLEKWDNFYQVSKNIYKLIYDYNSKSKQKKDILETQLKSLIDELSKIDKEAIMTKLNFKQKLLDDKKQLLNIHQQTEFLLAKENELTGTINKLKASINNTKKTIDNNEEQLTKYKQIYADLLNKKIVPIDENYKKNLLSSSLTTEKVIAAKYQEILLLEEQIKNAEKRKELILSQNICPFCNRPMDDSYKSELDKYLTGEINMMHITYQKLQEEHSNLCDRRSSLAKQVEELNKQINIYNENIRTKTELEGKISELESINKILYEQLDRDKQELKSKTIQLEDIQKLITGFTSDQLKEIKDAIELYTKEVENLKNELFKIDSLQSNIDQLKKQIDELNDDIIKYNRAQDLMLHINNILSVNGIQKVLISEALNDITTLANSYLAPLGKSIFFQFEKSKKSSDGVIPVFNTLVVNQYKEVCELDDLSGAEFVLVNFALRLALTILVANKYDFKYLIIDEGIKDLDEPYREFIASTLKSLADQFQIFLITHFSDFAYEFPNFLLVQKKNGISEVILN